MASDVAWVVKRLAVIALIAAGLVFAVQGGEFGTLDLIRQKREIAQLTHAVDSLHGVDSALKAYEYKVEHDPATQERIAREVFGMVRGDKELLYRFTQPSPAADSARRVPPPQQP